MRKTKIICTVGPSTDKENVLRDMMIAGMDVARFNFSHGDYEQHKQRFDMVKKYRKELDIPVATLLDTKGPEIRLGLFEDSKGVEIFGGDEFVLTTDTSIMCDNKRASISFKKLPGDVSIGTMILINDGLVSMKVKKIVKNEIFCTVIDGGRISNNKGVNVPNVSLSMPYLSEQDMSDLEIGSKLGFDFVAASFVRNAADVNYLRKFISSLGWKNVRIIAKIENADGVNDIDEIIEAADGIMIARGDMGVEIPFEKIPSIQKDIIQKVYKAGKQVITATQMLESMITNPRPTRAEITDVANAIYDGTSAIMLSGETAAGAFPVESIKTMALIAETTEADINYVARFDKSSPTKNTTTTNAISHATVTTAHDLGAKAIITVTKTGTTARMISKFRPLSPIIGCTTSESVYHQLNLSWGIIPLMCEEKDNTDELFDHAIHVAADHGYVKKDDLVVITAGIPLGISGTTNMLKVHQL